ncbi:putative multidrug resistance-associated protein lethal(2)03659 isoform X3 [Rhynchophorus ferrugineus]|uniref:putative multidrug resistance-associated protein lethal(2)03659 isoform X3 n=1 Tax=Rhynchophorus ferrugineus TaxID=354439 RepID=UPI003FCE8F71
MDGNVKKQRSPNHRENAFPLSAATFCYTIPTFLKGFKQDLEEDDLTETWTEHKSGRLGNLMEKYWKEEEHRATKKNKDPSLLVVLFRAFRVEFLLYGLILFISEAIRMSQPIFLGQLLQFYSPNDVDVSKNEAYMYAGGVVFCSLVNILIVHPYMMGAIHLGMKLRIACCTLIYRKSLKLSKTALGETTVGQVVNLLSNDVNRFDIACIFAHYLWLAPVETIVCTYLMYLHVGVSAIIGVFLVIMFIPMQIYLGKKISRLRLKTALRTDERMRLMNEIISGIQVIKMYAWEKPFAKLIALVRRNEIRAIKNTSYMRGIQLSFIMYSTRMSIFGSILAYVLLGHNITAEKVFVLTSFYNILRQTMTVFFPQGIGQVAEAMVSIRRLNKFMLYDETDIAKELKCKEYETFNGINVVADNKPKDLEMQDIALVGISTKDATAKWNESAQDNTLSEININVLPGKLLAVIGPVGSGKSSLLHLILRELPLKSGSLQVNGEISYASQEPWLFAGSVRQNILFGQPMDKTRYNLVVKKCALERDFQLLPYGDKTIVGDRGVSLSGGQRARINLARAVYKKADIYLLDDPLSAVDTHVGKALFKQCITGFLQDKTVILITHQLQYLKDVDHIIYLDNGKIKSHGNYTELQSSGFDFTKLLSDETHEEDKEHAKHTPHARERLQSIKSENSVDIEAPKQVEEQKSTGSVGMKIYAAYFKAGGNGFTIFIMFVLFLVAQVLGSGVDYFITVWVNIEQQDYLANNTVVPMLVGHVFNSTSNFTVSSVPTIEVPTTYFWHFSRETCMYIYSALIVLLITFTLVRAFVFFTICMKASTTLHDNMFKSITHATMRFFNTNSAGRILNRFSKDMGAVDEMLTSVMIDVLQIGLTLIGIIIVVAVVSPWLLLPTAGVGIVFLLMRSFYLRTSRSVKRLEGTTRSPVFSHLSATLQGLTTIRAFKAQTILTKEFDNYQDLHSSAWFAFISTSRAFGYWLDLMCLIYIALVTFSFLLIGNEKYGGNVGLAITQAIGLTGMLQWGMRQSTELENQMTSVERVVEYSSIEHEADLESTPDQKPPISWPPEGKIEFKNISLRYFPEDPPVLRDLSFTINPKEKIGIVGRTGAGKSSTINALFRLSDITGSILIDGIDITKLGLHDVRSKISIIPQEPVLFSGTMRKNLDPFDEYSDSDLWKALEDVELKETIQDLSGGLSTVMSEGGSNFSVGQRQLVCLSRAILRNNKILVMDEATANVDPQTDALIQETIRRNFAECTVLTIAHRLNTVMDSDRVLVMDAGTMIEFDHPYVLLQKQDGVLYGMVQQTGRSMAENLLKIAKENYETNASKQQ